MKTAFDINRRAALRTLGAIAAATSLPTWAAAPAPVASEGAAFDAAVAGVPWLKPFKGISDGGAADGDLRCESLAITGRWPAALRGRFYRNGPALFERDGQRYRHWFDGDGMVQQFTFSDRGVAHVGRLVRTPKRAAERSAGRFLYSAFGTPAPSDVPIQGPDSLNAANTNALEHAGRVLAMWEGGSAFELDPRDLSTRGAVTWQEGFEQMPFSAHPKVDPTGHLWNIGTFADKLVVWHVDAAGRLARVQTGTTPYPNGMAHDVAVTAQYIVLPLPPVKMNYGAVARGATAEQAFVFERAEPLRILVMRKDDIAQRRVFELPAQLVFHVGNAYERSDGSIALSFVGAPDASFLTRGAVAFVAGRIDAPAAASMHTAVLDLRTGRASVESVGNGVEFPRIDPRRIGSAARFVATAASWRNDAPRRGALFHGVQLQDLQTGSVDRFDYGDRIVVEEHIVVPRSRGGGERDAWLVGTTFDAARQVSVVNVIDGRRVGDGPIAQATLPYWLPLGFHGNFTAA
ncbi:MAG TPA: carotenoid oxygenase family protein [Caldimonas sp.]|nr:carotenoid oxygenase family protein [Caldimonas sp.]HEV7577966.1 carotenoid oxygenase family protein [Caldimonas sp.]